MLQDVDMSPTPDSRGWTVLLLIPVVRSTNHVAVDMCAEHVGQNGMDGEDNNDGACSKVNARARTNQYDSILIDTVRCGMDMILC